MQVASALNNTIRILFNPRVESFRLLDFLIVKSIEDRYLAQIIEIYEDKFDASQNVAKLRLFYKIAQNNEVMPYDNFTPSKECEITKVKPEEIERFINNDKKTFAFATNIKNSQSLNIQYDFFYKNAIILADKIENANSVSLNLAKKLSSERHCVFIDFTGIVEFEEAKTIKAAKQFKMPLNFDTIDLVFDKCLSNASLEFQATGYEIQNAIKTFAKKQENGFIPFNAFLHVLLEQYKVTPYPELQLMLARMKKYQMSDIFVKNKRDYETLSNTIKKNEITIIDLSGLDSFWQKAYMEYIVSEIKEDIFLLARINEEGFDTDLISKIYNKKPNIKFVPNVSYNYSKLPSIIQYCKNYILLPSLYQRNDFLDANFALANITSQDCIIFGENTDGFLYQARDYELEVQEKRKNYRKIALSLIDEDEEAPVSENNITDSQKLIEELSNLEEGQNEVIEVQEENEKDEFPELDEKEPEAQDDFQEVAQKSETEEIPKEVETIKNIEEIKLSNEPVEEPVQNVEQAEIKEAEEVITPEVEPAEQKEDFEISDEELDFFELAESSAALEQQENVVIDNVEYKTKSDNYENNIKETTEDNNKEQEVDLSEVATSAVENNFEEVINSKKEVDTQGIEIDENTTIQVDLNESEKENLPIFKEETEEEADSKQEYQMGQTVIHKKYGKGQIVKIIQYDQRQLLQIDFEESGKKLLDPKVAEILLEK